jgi:hypothetical protein
MRISSIEDHDAVVSKFLQILQLILVFEFQDLYGLHNIPCSTTSSNSMTVTYTTIAIA